MEDITFFAETNFRDQKRRFGIKRADRRKHVYMVGKTGMGKTTLLENMAIQDIQNGNGVGIVDPHGEFAEKMLDFVPKERMKDVIYFNPADTAYPVAFNSMESVLPEQRHLISSGLLGVFKKIWPDVWSARMEYLLSNAILALLEIPGSTLLGINRMFGDKEFRKSVVSRLADPVVRAFWEKEYAQYQERFATEASAAIQNKVGQFVSNPLIRNIIGQERSSVDMRKIMDEGKIFIMNISKGKVGEENSRLLGAMLVTKLYLTAMTRVDIPHEEDRRDFYLYVDEFQNFATESFASILSEARKYRLNLTLAHQYITQMDETVRDAVLGNVGTMIVFRIGAQDAEMLENEFAPEFMPQDPVNLGFAQIYLKLMIDGIASRPFSALTIPPFPKPNTNFREDIIAYSRATFGSPVAEVKEKIEHFHGIGLPVGDSPSAAGRAGSAGVASDTVARTADSYGARGGRKRQDDRKMYEAQCFIDGEKIMVPFVPDRRRPVYCEKHLEMLRRGELPQEEGRKQPARPSYHDQNQMHTSGQRSVSNQLPAPLPRAAPPVSLEVLRQEKGGEEGGEGEGGVGENSRAGGLSDPMIREFGRKDVSREARSRFHSGGIGARGAIGDTSAVFHGVKPQRKEVDLDGLRQAIGASLKNIAEEQPIISPEETEPVRLENKKSGVMKPGEKVTFE